MTPLLPLPKSSASKQKPVLALALAGTVFLATYLLALCVMEQQSPATLLFGSPAATTTTGPSSAVLRAPENSRRNVVVARAEGMEVKGQRGQYTDIDGKGNVYALEPKMSVESAEASGSRTLIGGLVGLVVLAIAIASLGKLNNFEAEKSAVFSGPTLTEISAQIQSQIDA